MLDKYFSSGSTVAHTDTQFLTDEQFDRDSIHDTPVTTRELKNLEIQFKGSFLSLYGEVQHVDSESRPDLSNPMNRLGVFQSAPSQLGFDSIH